MAIHSTDDAAALNVLRRPKITVDTTKPRCAGCGEVFRPDWADSDAKDTARFCTAGCERQAGRS